MLQENVTFSLPDKNNNLIEISCYTNDKNIAAPLANHAAESCVKYINADVINANAKIVWLANRPIRPISPNPLLNLIISIFVSVFFAIVGVVLLIFVMKNKKCQKQLVKL